METAPGERVTRVVVGTVPGCSVAGTLRVEWHHADDPAPRAVVLEPYSTAYFGEERVVLAQTDVETGTEPLSPLPDQDRPAGHEVAIVALDTQSLRVAVAPVP